MADAAQTAVLTFPGVRAAQTARGQIEECARAYGLLGTAPPAPTARDAWEPLLTRAAHTLSPDGKYVGEPARCNVKGGLAAPLESAPRIHNGFVLWTRHEGGEHSIVSDSTALETAIRAMPPGTLPPALGRLAGVFGLPPLERAPTPAAAGGLFAAVKRMFGLGSAPVDADGTPFVSSPPLSV